MPTSMANLHTSEIAAKTIYRVTCERRGKTLYLDEV